MPASTPATRFDGVNIYTTTYKTIGDHGIEVNVLVPKSHKPEAKSPLMVKYHGGAFVTGTAMYPDWFAGYIIPFVERHNGIIVCPNYRLLPESSGTDMLADLTDLYFWLRHYLQAFVDSESSVKVEVDLDHVIATGESAGGYMALQSALTQPNGFIKGTLCQFPMTITHDTIDRTSALGVPIPPRQIVDEYVANLKPGQICSGAEPPARLGVGFALTTHCFRKYMGDEKRLNPIEAIESATYFAPCWIIHGNEDEAVDHNDTLNFAKKVNEVLPESEVRLSIEKGNHGFDNELVEEETEWLRDGLQWLGKKWVQ